MTEVELSRHVKQMVRKLYADEEETPRTLISELHFDSVKHEYSNI